MLKMSNATQQDTIETKVSAADGASDNPEPEQRKEIAEIGDSYTPEEEKAVLRKIDLAVLPMVRQFSEHTQPIAYTRTDMWCLLSSISRQAKSELRQRIRSDHGS
jgi:hypothetical protein